MVRVLNAAGDWPLVVIAASPECSPDAGRPVAVVKEGALTLSAGAYGEVSVGKGAEVVLTGGRYDVQSLEVEKEAKVYFAGASEVCIAGRFYLGKDSVIRPAEGSGLKGADLVIHVNGGDGAGEMDEDDEGAAATLGKNSIMFGRVWALNGTIEVKKASQVTGSLTGKDVVVGKGSVVVRDTTPTAGDVIPPRILGINPGDGSVVDTLTPVISGSYSDEGTGIDVSSVRIVLNGVDVTGEAAVSVSGFSLTPAGLTEGPQGIEVYVKDAAGNAASAVSHFTVDVDVTLPEIVGVQPSEGAVLRDATPLLSAGFLDADSGVDASTIRIALDGQDITAATGANAAGFSYIASPALSDGAHSLEIAVADLSGNVAQVARRFRTDVSAPGITIAMPAEGSLMAAATPEISGTWGDAATGTDVGSARVFVDEAGIGLTGAVVNEAGFQVPVTAAMSDGAHTVKVEVKDTAGNLRSVTTGFTTDITPPVFSQLSPANGSVLTANLVTVSLSYSDATSGIDPAGVKIALDDGDVTPQAVVSETSLQYTTTEPLSDGGHQVAIRVVDVADNGVDVALSFQILSDLLPPEIGSLAPVNGAYVNTATPALSGSFSDNLSGVNVSSVVLTLDGADITASGVVSETGFSVVPSGLSDGEHRLTVAVRDNRGNGASAGTGFTVDTVAPVVTALQTPAANAAGWNPTDVAVSFSATDAGSGVAGVSPVEVITVEGGGCCDGERDGPSGEQWIGIGDGQYRQGAAGDCDCKPDHGCGGL